MTKIINKAAEEGGRGLPPLPEMNLIVTEKPGVRFESRGYTNKQMHDYAREAIAADRAARPVASLNEDQKWLIECAEMASSGSYPDLAGKIRTACKATVSVARPVANKAGVEGIASSEIPEGWPTEIWLNAGDEDLAPFSEYDELSWCSLPQGENDIRYVREDLLATPPATTGASTVLTDERKRAMFEEWATKQGGYDLSPYNWRVKSVGGVPYTGYVRPYKQDCTVHAFEGFIAALGEVAAQAGQVAVPDGFVLMPRSLTAGNGAKGLLCGEFNEKITVECPECNGDDECSECDGEGRVNQDVTIGWDAIKRIYDMAVAHLASPAQAAPLPAGQPMIGKLLDQFSELPVLWGLNEPGALVRHGDVFKMLIAAGKAEQVQAPTSGERQEGGAA